MEILHNTTVTDMDGLDSKDLEAYYNKNPWKYYQNYVAGSISPYYDAKLACIGAAEEMCEFLNSRGLLKNLDEAGDFLFQLTNIANFHHINLEHIPLYVDHNKVQPNSDKLVYWIIESFGEVLSAIMKMARYPDYQEVFQAKWGMTAEERINAALSRTIVYLTDYLYENFGMSLKYIMDCNLHKLDERHSADGVYCFGSGFRNTLSNGSNTNR